MTHNSKFETLKMDQAYLKFSNVAGKSVKFALNALKEFNSNTNFSTGTTVFFKKCGNRISDVPARKC
jgi:hypothetical protein